MLSPITLLIFLIATLTVAAPVPEPQTPSVIFERMEQPAWAVQCEAPRGWSHTYTRSYIEKTFTQLKNTMNLECKENFETSEAHNYQPLRRLKNGRHKCYPANFMTNQPNPSPKVIDKLNNISNCQIGWAGKSYLEFPMGPVGNPATDEIYTGGEPGAHRILAIADLHAGRYSNVEYCLIMMHESLDAPGFVPCTV